MFKKLNLFSRTELELLDYISTKEGEFYGRQIARETKISIGSVNSILKHFEKIELVQKQKKGKMLFYRRNEASPVLRQFKVFITISCLVPTLDKITPFSRRVILFGSCAEGRNGENSDIDLFILTNEKEKIRRRLDEEPEIQAIILDSIEYTSLQNKDKPLYDRINRGVVLYDEDTG